MLNYLQEYRTSICVIFIKPEEKQGQFCHLTCSAATVAAPGGYQKGNVPSAQGGPMMTSMDSLKNRSTILPAAIWLLQAESRVSKLL